MSFYVIVLLATVTTGLVMGFVSTTLIIGYAIGISLSTVLVISVLRKLGYRAQSSIIASSVFHHITRYKATIYNIQIQGQQPKSATIYGNAHEYADLLDILKGMKFTTTKAKEAAKHATDISQEDTPFEDKVRVALQYLGGNEHKDIAKSD